MNKNCFFDILLSPYISEKSTISIEKFNTLVLKVSNFANKIEIKKTIKKIFNVEAKKVNIITVKKKKKRNGRNVFFQKKWKKAYISLKPGHNLNFMKNTS